MKVDKRNSHRTLEESVILKECDMNDKNLNSLLS